MTNLIKTETKKSVQAGTHTLSNFSELTIHSTCREYIYLSFDLEGHPSFNGWCMNAYDINELIGVLSEIRDVLKGNN